MAGAAAIPPASEFETSESEYIAMAKDFQKFLEEEGHDLATDKTEMAVEMKDEDRVPPKGKKRRQRQNPNPPKRPISAYVFFCNAKRPRMEELMPQARIGDVVKELAKLWASMDPKKRSQWENLAKSGDDGESSNKSAKIRKARLLVQEEMKQEMKDEGVIDEDE